MKISYNDMFTNISDVAYEILEENDMFNDETDDMFSSDRICKDVTDMIHDQKIVRKRHFAIKSVLLVAALAAMSSILAIAHNYGAALIDDSNRHLVGKGLHGEGQIIGADEEIEVPDEPSDGIWETTARIKSYKNVSISPNSITEFAVSGDAGQYITPEIIFGNNDLVIFEQEDGSGWELNEGETLMIQATEYEADQNNSAIFRMNYVGKSHVNDNGVMAPDYMTFDLGYKHKTKINSTPVTLTAMCYNVLGKDYWISRGTSVALGAPRTMMLSAQFDI